MGRCAHGAQLYALVERREVTNATVVVTTVESARRRPNVQ
jgi:hypothetical protein